MRRKLLFAAAVALPVAPLQAQALLHQLDSPNPQSTGYFGFSIAGLPDVDGDGRGDLLVGAPLEDPPGSPSGAGRAYLFSGATGALLRELASPREREFSNFGFSVAGLPDVDGDARGDFLVAAIGENGGLAYVFSGASGLPRLGLRSPNVESVGGFGRVASGVPDVDGDGVADVVVGAPFEDPGASPEWAGRAHVFSGATGEHLHELGSPSEDYHGLLGISVSGVPDLDGDGLGDLLVGASSESDGASPNDAGRAYVFSGASGALLRTLVSPNEEESGAFGEAVAGLEDVDGDGRGDLLVGAHNEGPGSSPGGAGRAYVFSGASGTLLAELRSPGEQFDGAFGTSVSALPDTDADGVVDLAVGAQEETFGGMNDAGRAYVFSGASGALLYGLASPGPTNNGWFGAAVAGVPDANGDGRGDLLVGAYQEIFGHYGRAYLFSGASASLTLDAAAFNSPVPRGGRLRFGVTLTNLTAAPLSGDLTLDVTGPDGATYARLLEDDRTLDGGATRALSYGLPVYGDAALGVYTATVTALEGGTANLGEATFTFEVVPVAPVAGVAARTVPAGVFGEVEVLGGAAAATAPGALAVLAPNPAAGRATVALTLDQPAEVRLALYDVIGREAAAVDPGALGAGAHRIGLDVSSLPSGVYVWRLVAGERVEAGRLTVVR